MIVPVLAAAVFISCSSPEEKRTGPVEQNSLPTQPLYENFEKGKVLNPVFIKGDSTQSYALYLPTSYNTEKKYPAIYFFDPHAGGHIPIDKYKDLAEKYDFILIGSNN